MKDCCESQFKTCGFRASIGHAYWHFFVSKKSTGFYL